MTPAPLKAVIFDLDGTLVDTADEFVVVVQTLRAEHGMPPMDAQRIRASVSNGARALVALGLGLDEEAPEFEDRRLRLLELYGGVLGSAARPYPGIADLLQRLAQRGVAWGVSTNKPRAYAEPLLRNLGMLADGDRPRSGLLQDRESQSVGARSAGEAMAHAGSTVGARSAGETGNIPTNPVGARSAGETGNIPTNPVGARSAGEYPPCASLVCPDDVTNRKPHPESLYRVCHDLDCAPREAVYVGDHRRDIEAGRRAGMYTVAAAYGYIEPGDDAGLWGANALVARSTELADLILNL